MKKTSSKKRTSRKSKTVLTDQTDWKRIDAMTDEDIDFSDNPEATPEMFARAVLRRNHKVVPRKKEFPILLDSEVYWWYLKQGRGYDARINSVLRATWKSMNEMQVTRAAIEAARKIDWLITIPGWRGWKTPLTLGYYLSRFQRF